MYKKPVLLPLRNDFLGLPPTPIRLLSYSAEVKLRLPSVLYKSSISFSSSNRTDITSNSLSSQSSFFLSYKTNRVLTSVADIRIRDAPDNPAFFIPGIRPYIGYGKPDIRPDIPLSKSSVFHAKSVLTMYFSPKNH